ncbi:MAG: Txe/YoeB family addiction module toxin [Puniceicoccales bacterium]|nr:Txe/YoeB family addiction module toxin [Puniceicoccales bacterium]
MKLKTERRYDNGLKKLLSSVPHALDKLERLVSEVQKSPRSGIGHPEQLKGYRPRVVWSRHITAKHRLVYEIKDNDDCIVFLSCYGHYKDH